jgi:hypothetical protein
MLASRPSKQSTPDDVNNLLAEAVKVLHVYDRCTDQRVLDIIKKLAEQVRKDHPGRIAVKLSGGVFTREI